MCQFFAHLAGHLFSHGLFALRFHHRPLNLVMAGEDGHILDELGKSLHEQPKEADDDK